jgi:hypothetical protein
LIGKVNTTSIGFIIALTNPKTIATTMEVPKLSMATPGITLAVTNTAIPLISKLIKNCIFLTSFTNNNY